MFASRMYWDLIGCIIFFAHEMFPVPVPATQPERMMDPPPGFTDTHLAPGPPSPPLRASSQCEGKLYTLTYTTGIYILVSDSSFGLENKKEGNPQTPAHPQPSSWLETLSILLLEIETMGSQALSCVIIHSKVDFLFHFF